MLMTEYNFELFGKQDLQDIVDAHFAGHTAFVKLDLRDPYLATYACDKQFCEAALKYLTGPVIGSSF